MEADKFGQIHDRLVDILGISLPEELVEVVAETLPTSIHSLAEEWTWWDTEVGDFIFIHLKENKDKYKELLKIK